MPLTKQLSLKNLRVLLFLIGFTTCSSCYRTPNIHEQIIQHAILSKEFQDYYNICKRRTRTFYVYHDTAIENKLSFSLKNNCNQKINFLKINFEFNINSILERQHKGVVLYKYISSNDTTELSFVDLTSNANLTLKYDRNLNLLTKSSGVF